MSILINNSEDGSVHLEISKSCLFNEETPKRSGTISPRLNDALRVSPEKKLGDTCPNFQCHDQPSTWKKSWIAGKLFQALKTSDVQADFGWTNQPAQMGDCVIARVTKNGNHSRLFTHENIYSRIYQGDTVLGVLGTRYATDAFHAPMIDPHNLHLLTNAGLMGTVTDRHASCSNPTRLKLMSYLMDREGRKINFKDTFFRPVAVPSNIFPIFVVGTGMNSGKTTSTARIGQYLAAEGLRVAIIKLTGSGSQRDVHEYSGTGCVFAADFSDYGFPSTYLAELEELHGLYGQMLQAAADHQPQVVLVEIADGIFQRETEMLLQSSFIHESGGGVVLTALCAASALAADSAVKNLGWKPIAVTGLITNSPLFVDEFSARSRTPVFDTENQLRELCHRIIAEINQRQQVTKMSA